MPPVFKEALHVVIEGLYGFVDSVCHVTIICLSSDHALFLSCLQCAFVLVINTHSWTHVITRISTHPGYFCYILVCSF